MKKKQQKFLIIFLISLVLTTYKEDVYSNSKMKEIENYKTWEKITKEPWQQPPLNARDCSLPISMMESIDVEGKIKNPHIDKYINIYVNDIGKDAMLEKTTFPIGSIIVKEKFSKELSSSIELLTVMIKHQRNYNSDNGDWEYAILDGKNSSLQDRGKLFKCQSCHTYAKDSDYVFRSYLD